MHERKAAIADAADAFTRAVTTGWTPVTVSKWLDRDGVTRGR